MKIVLLFSLFRAIVLSYSIFTFNTCPDKQNHVSEKHDWECNFIVEDWYTNPEKKIYHYINEYETNENGDIAFISHDGLFTMIPRDNFCIIANEKL
jgi:hypothetical protein